MNDITSTCPEALGKQSDGAYFYFIGMKKLK
jgi:hypothetical protein